MPRRLPGSRRKPRPRRRRTPNRCPSLRPSHRVEIYASLRRNPFIPWRGAHLFALPWIANHHMRWDIRLKRMMGFDKRSHWRFIEQLNAYEKPFI